MADYSDREQCGFFGEIVILNIEERNDLDAYLNSLPEFKEWDELGYLLTLQRAMLTRSAKFAGSLESMNEVCNSLLPRFRRYKELGEILRQKVKNWCRAMVDEAA